MTGPEGGTRLFARMVGARDLGLGLGLLGALNRGAPVRGWLEASAVVDGIDTVACLLARDHIRTRVLPGAVGLAAAGALLSAWLARQLDPAQPPCRERGDNGRPSAALLPRTPSPHSPAPSAPKSTSAAFPSKGGVYAAVTLTSAADEQRACRGAISWGLLRWQSDTAAKLITRACLRVKAGVGVGWEAQR